MSAIVWIGLASTDKIFRQLVKKGYFHAPTHNAQKNIIIGIENYLHQPIDTINGFMMPSFPKCSELITKGMQWSHQNGAIDISVPSLNIKYLDFIFRKFFMKKYGIKWAKKHKQESDIYVLVYAASEPYLAAAMEIQKIIPFAHICLIIPDLPQYMELNCSKFKKFLKNIRWKNLQHLILRCDSYILFTKHMASYLQIENKHWMVMEGSINPSEQLTHITCENKEEIIIMYSGGIDIKYGIPELLCAFGQISNNNYRLWFTGSGNAEQLILEKSKKDFRIKYFGFLSERNDILKLQQQATMLITTRMPTEAASAYCFPSKIFEYLLSGKPVLSFRIRGIPDNYFDYLIEIKSPNPNDIKDSIIKVGNMSENDRKHIGNAGKNFVLREKNCNIQGKRICQFLNLKPTV